MATKLTQQQLLLGLFTILALSSIAIYFFKIDLSTTAGAVSEGEVLSISKTTFCDSPSCGVTDGRPIVKAEVAMTGAGDWIVGETASSIDAPLQNVINSLTGQTMPHSTVPFEINFKLDDSSCTYDLRSSTSQSMLRRFNNVSTQPVNVILKTGDTRVSYACAASLGTPGLIGITYNGNSCTVLPVGCYDSYTAVCEANGGKHIKCGAGTLGSMCQRAVWGNNVPKIADNGRYTAAVSGEVRINHVKVQTFSVNANGIGTVSPPLSGSVNVIKKVSMVGGLTRIGTPWCIEASSIEGYTNSAGQTKFVNKNIAVRDVTFESGEVWDTLSNSITAHNNDVRTLLRSSPELEIFEKSTISISGGQLKISRGIENSIVPVLTIDLDAESVGIRNVMSNPSVICPTDKITSTIGGSAQTLRIGVRNNGTSGANAWLGVSCPIANVVPESYQFAMGDSGSITYKEFSLRANDKGTTSCLVTAKDPSSGQTKSTCSFNFEGKQACTLPPMPPGNWRPNYDTCRWECAGQISCPSGKTWDNNLCDCVTTAPPPIIPGECDPLIEHAHRTTGCNWECDTGYVLSYDPTLRRSVCAPEVVIPPEEMSCYQRVEARICEPWDLFCPINKNIDKLGCSLQELFTNTVYIVIGISLIIAISLGVFILLKKRRRK